LEKQILIVDDDSNFLDGLKQKFHTHCQRWGICFARSVDAAWEYVSQVAFEEITNVFGAVFDRFTDERVAAPDRNKFCFQI
jgi:hypothetical protein